MNKRLLVSAAFLLGASRAEAQLVWRGNADVPPATSKDCPLRKLEPYFWDFLENNDKPIHQQDWERLGARRQAAAISEHCGSAVQLHDVFVDVKVRLDYALRMARGGEQLTPGEKISLIDRTLSETKPSAGMVEEHLGPDSELVMVLKDTRRVLSIERANLAARRGAERVGDMETKSILQGAGRIRAVSGDLGAQKQAGDTLFQGADRRPSETAVPERPRQPAQPLEGEAPAGGSLRAKSSKYDSGTTRDIPAPSEASPSQKKFFESTRKAFGHGKDPLEEEKAAKKQRDEELRSEGFSRSESAFIQKRKDDAWFGFGWLAERRAKMDVDSVRSSVKNCSERPNFCAKLEEECLHNPDLHGSCDTFKNRDEIRGR